MSLLQTRQVWRQFVFSSSNRKSHFLPNVFLVRNRITRLALISKSDWSNNNNNPMNENNKNPAEKLDQYKLAADSGKTPHFKEFLEKSSAAAAAQNPEKPEKSSKTGQMLSVAQDQNTQEYLLPHPIWSTEEVDNVTVTHKSPENFTDKMAFYSVMALRKSFDIASGYTIGKELKTLDERSILIRCIFLETVAGVPGFSAAMIRHLHSLRRMQRDHGWIHTLLEEAENERMHLMTFLTLRRPGPIFRTTVIVSQWLFTFGFCLAYMVSPRFCHRFVGYLEEQAVITYTHILEEIDSGRLPMWERLPAPEIAVRYWQLRPDALMRDVILAIRADEAHHRLVNHTLGSMKVRDSNPFKPGE